MDTSLKSAAERLGENREIMESYENFERGSKKWFYSINPQLLGAVFKPTNFRTWTDWDNMSTNQKDSLQKRLAYLTIKFHQMIER